MARTRQCRQNSCRVRIATYAAARRERCRAVIECGLSRDAAYAGKDERLALTKKYQLSTQNNNMTRLDANVYIPPDRQWLHRGTTGDQMLLAPVDVNLSEISLKDRLLDRPAPHVLRR